MNRKFHIHAIAAATWLALATPFNTVAIAGNHPLSYLADVNTVDYVVNVDWDFDAPPAQAFNSSQVLDRAYITNVLRVTAQSKFTMTEGRHRIGTVFVYKNALFGNNVDIRLLNTDGRSAANVSGWGVRNATSFNHLSMNKTPEKLDEVGKVITHELGHYTYGLLDEYREDGKAFDPADPGSPSGIDTPKDSIMNNHLNFVSLSTPKDYADPAARQTAQARTMGNGSTGMSGWEMLTRTADQDPPGARSQGRTFFEAFRGMDPNALQLTRPTVGFDAKFNVVFVANPVFRDVILVDRTLPKDRFDSLVQAAKALVAEAKDNVRYAVVALPSSGDGTVQGLTAATADGKQALAKALDGLTPDASGVFDSATAFAKARALVASERQAGDPSTIHYLTGAEATVPAQAVTDLRTAKMAVNPLGLTGATAEQKQARRALERKRAGGPTVTLSNLANSTGGSYNSAKNGADAAKDATKAVKDAHADPFASIAFGLSDALQAGGVFDTPFRVAPAASDGEVVVSAYFDPSDAGKLSFSLIAPSGKVYTSQQLPDGIHFASSASEGTAEITIDPGFAGRAGVWTLRTVANAATAEAIGVDVAGLTRLALSVHLTGGSVASGLPPVLTATLGGDKRIKGAKVTATLYDEAGHVAIDGLVLSDDGVTPDQRGGDGQYSVSLAGRLNAGEYFAVVNAETNSGSRTATLGALIKGALDAEEAVDLITRVTELDFELEANASGVLSSSTTSTTTASSGGGGCTVNPLGNDASLALLMLAGLAGWGLRRRSRQS